MHCCGRLNRTAAAEREEVEKQARKCAGGAGGVSASEGHAGEGHAREGDEDVLQEYDHVASEDVECANATAAEMLPFVMLQNR